MNIAFKDTPTSQLHFDQTYFSMECPVADVFLSHMIYLWVLAQLESLGLPLWNSLIILSLKRKAEHVLNFRIPQIVFLFKRKNSQNQICKPKCNQECLHKAMTKQEIKTTVRVGLCQENIKLFGAIHNLDCEIAVWFSIYSLDFSRARCCCYPSGKTNNIL